MSRAFRWTGAAAALLMVAGCERPPVDVQQSGFRGLGIQYVENPRTLADSLEAIEGRLPAPINALPAMEPAPAGVYENVQVLGHLSQAEFTVTMQAITNWVAPEEGCNYCHVVTPDSVNYASDAIYTKLVSRRMLQMTQDINVNWRAHVGDTVGVNCWTCHQGKPVPTNYWFYNGNPEQPERHYLDRDGLRVQGPYALASEGENPRGTNDAEYAYAVMINMTNGMGVNCTYCHNSARFADWSESSPQRVTALRGLRMIRDANMQYMVSLQDVWPTEVSEYAGYPDRPRRGPLGDGPKLSCATCHQGAYKPQYSNEAGYADGWRALTQIGVPGAQLEDGTEDEDN
ncbi:MAG: photosynthetic reaction center cytochrome PufC [Gemmatimonadota bacterium]|jgi:photosynthetic reaction center cytochrome c subunit